MRRNLLIGLCLTALVSLAAGDYAFNRLSGAQDAPKKAEPDEKKSDLFELLKKELDGKKGPDAPQVLPPVDLPRPDGVVSTGAQEKAPLPPVVDAPKPGPLPLPQGKPEEPKPVVDAQGPVIPAPTPIAPPSAINPAITLPVNTQPLPNAPRSLDPPPPNPSAGTSLPAPHEQSHPPLYLPSQEGTTKELVKPKQDQVVKPVIGTMPSLPPASEVLPRALPATAPIHATPQAAKTKTSPWTLHIEVVDDMTIVTATVNKKHEFKVVCQNLEVMTGKDAFKASGKVKISGDSINGSCERLAISLTDDRLVLEGGAEVQIQKTITQVSSDDGKPAAFELKGETLNLRISELQAGKVTQASFRNVEVDGSIRSVVSDSPAPRFLPGAKEWSPYGKLRRVDGNWRLEDKAGRTILRIETTNGKLLESYDGRTVSVLGPMVDRMTVRVTHIAVP
jgi:hypothetical protein